MSTIRYRIGDHTDLFSNVPQRGKRFMISVLAFGPGKEVIPLGIGKPVEVKYLNEEEVMAAVRAKLRAIAKSAMAGEAVS